MASVAFEELSDSVTFNFMKAAYSRDGTGSVSNRTEPKPVRFELFEK
jgi:hypothetical protein